MITLHTHAAGVKHRRCRKQEVVGRRTRRPWRPAGRRRRPGGPGASGSRRTCDRRPPSRGRASGARRCAPCFSCWTEQEVLERPDRAGETEEQVMEVPARAQAPAQAPQLGQALVPHLQVANPSRQAVGELGKVLHRPDVLHEDLLLREERQRGGRRRHKQQQKQPRGAYFVHQEEVGDLLSIRTADVSHLCHR